MPFTFSHPAIILPLISIKRKWRSSTGLIIGSITPDFEYFIRMNGKSIYSHTLSGIFWFDLPLAVVLCFVYHLIVRNPLVDNLPPFLRMRLAAFKRFQWGNYYSKNFIVVVISILIGATSHLFWDSFTHDNGFFVNRLTILTKDLQVGTLSIPVYKLFKFLSSVLGGLIILSVIMKIRKQPETKRKTNAAFWLVFAGVICAVLALRVYVAYRLYQEFNVIMTFIAGGLIALVLASLVFKNK